MAGMCGRKKEGGGGGVKAGLASSRKLVCGSCEMGWELDVRSRCVCVPSGRVLLCAKDVRGALTTGRPQTNVPTRTAALLCAVCGR